jgi:hypothetical protein
MKQNERVSAQQDSASLVAVLEELPVALDSLVGKEVILATYGYGSGLHPDLCYTPMKVGIAWLERFIRESLDQRIAKPGESDFVFEVRRGELEVEICHDAHVHVSGSNLEFIDRILENPQFLRVFQSSGPSKSAA